MAATQLSATSICMALPVLDLSVTAGLGSCAPLQNCHPGRDSPGDPGRVEPSWTGMDAVAPCTRTSQRAKLSLGLAGE